MKNILRNYGVNMNAQQRMTARSTAILMTQTRGTAQGPKSPRNIICQAGPRGILVTWNLPTGFNADIQGWRVYKDDENTLYAKVADRGTRQYFIESTAGSTPAVTNVFVSSINSLGMESAKVQSQGKATVEAGAPSMPNVPPGYNDGGAGGGDKKGGYL